MQVLLQNLPALPRQSKCSIMSCCLADIIVLEIYLHIAFLYPQAMVHSLSASLETFPGQPFQGGIAAVTGSIYGTV